MKLGFIGMGNMASAILLGALKAGYLNPAQVWAYDLLPRVPEDFPYEAVGITRDYPWAKGRTEVPVWYWQGHVIWGMTARIVKDILSK